MARKTGLMISLLAFGTLTVGVFGLVKASDSPGMSYYLYGIPLPEILGLWLWKSYALVWSASAILVLYSWTTMERPPTTVLVCRKCGYDLRATPDRCPECGTVPLAKDAKPEVTARL